MEPRRRVRVVRVIARLNAGGPAHQVGLLSSRLGDPYDTLLVHGQVDRDEAPLSQFDERYPSHRIELADLGREIRLGNDLRMFVRLALIMRRVRPHIVHTHTAKSGLVGRLAALTLRPRPVIVHTFHGHVLEGYFGERETNFYRRVERLLARASDCVIGVSDSTVEDLRRIGVGSPATLRVVRLGLELEPFLVADERSGEEFRREFGLREGETLVVTVGRLVAIKRHDVAIRAAARAHAGNCSIRLVIVGDGPLRAELEALAETLGMGDRVHFAGYRGDLVQIASGADVALLSSDSEGTPVWLIEASACGVPAVTTNAGGVREVVPEGAGIVVPRGDHEALGAALAELTGDPKRRATMGAAARRHVAQRYAAGRLLRDIERLYAELLARRPRRGAEVGSVAAI